MNRTAILQSAGRAARAGFTLVELLLVITILGILAGVVTMQLGGHSETARVNATRQSIATIEQAIQIFQIQRSTLPTRSTSSPRPAATPPPRSRRTRGSTAGATTSATAS